jgi:Putative amidoligase enzyme
MRIGHYHSTQASWRQAVLRGDWVGVELEVRNEQGNQVAANSLDAVNFGSYEPPIAEYDGSLSRLHGVEIICPPLPVEEVLAGDGYIARMMQALRDAGTHEGGIGYGMHVNFNVADWPFLLRHVVAYALSARRVDTVAVGRRALNHACNGRPAMMLVRRVDREGAFRQLVSDTSKYQPARMRTSSDSGEEPQILEFRAPASTLVHDNLAGCVNYVYDTADAIRPNLNLWAAVCFIHSMYPSRRFPARNATTAVLRRFISRVNRTARPRVFGAISYDRTTHAEQAIRIARLIAQGARLRDATTVFGATLAQIAEANSELGVSEPAAAATAPPPTEQAGGSSEGGMQTHGLTAAEFFAGQRAEILDRVAFVTPADYNPVPSPDTGQWGAGDNRGETGQLDGFRFVTRVAAVR